MKTLYMPIAPSGAGKSTFFRKLKTEGDVTSGLHPGMDIGIFSLDDLRHRWYDSKDYARAFLLSTEDKQFEQKANKEYLEVLSQHEYVYVDNTNLSKKRRRFYLDEAKRRGFKTVAILFPIALDTLLERQHTRGDKNVPAEAVRRQYMSLQLPSFGEFDEVVSV